MSFEISDRDLLGRIGRLATKDGTLETPAFLPVINPGVQKIPPREMWANFNLRAVITNAYILKRHYAAEAAELGVHRLLDFPGVIMTDSGAYQLLRYGKVAIEPLEIVKFQEEIGTDIAVILDIPTNWRTPRSYAEKTVDETLRRAAEALENLKRKDILWVGPIQGGRYLDLVASSAKRMAALPFPIYALGSPTEVMEQYLFGTLADMIMNAKIHLPPDKPLHLFGAGHPFLFSFAVALGCDLFDSAAYAIYARDGRYLLENGTVRLEELDHFPCACPVCSSTTPKELKAKWHEERESFLTRHNLYICLSEVNRVKQAIRDGRLCELLELRARSHPSLLQALKGLTKYAAQMERYTPITKRRGIFIFGSTSLSRPEVIRHQRSLATKYTHPKGLRVLLLLPQGQAKPFSSSPEYMVVEKILRELGVMDLVHVCSYTPPFGVIPLEVDDVFPLSQFEAARPFGGELKANAARKISAYVKSQKYEEVILHRDLGLLDVKALRGGGTYIKITAKRREPWSEEALQELKNTLDQTLKPLRRGTTRKSGLSGL